MGRSREIIEAMLASATEILDMDAAFVAELIGSRLYFRAFEGNAESFGLKEGESIPFDQSYCKRLIEGRISGIVRDAERDERVQDLEVTREAKEHHTTPGERRAQLRGRCKTRSGK